MRRLAKLARRIGLLDGVRPAGLRALVKSRLKPSPTTVLRFHAANQPDHVALAYRDRRYTYAELDGEMDRVAAALQAEGLGAGDGSLLMLEIVP